MKLDFLDPSILENFKIKVSDHADFLINKYKNCNDKNKMNAILSAKDWLHIVINSIPYIDIENKNADVKSINVMQFVMMIDILTEAVQQINRVLFNNKNYALVNDKSIFKKKISDDKYFSHIRAVFAAHPVNLDSDIDGIKTKRKYFASWSSVHGTESFNVILYSNEPNEDSKKLSIYFNDIMNYAKKRYTLLNEFCEEIDRQVDEHIDKFVKTSISKEKNTLKQLEILKKENDIRFGDYGYKWEIEELLSLYSAPMEFPKEKTMYRNFLQKIEPVIEGIYNNLQQMNYIDLNIEPSPSYHRIEKLKKHDYYIKKTIEFLKNPNDMHYYDIIPSYLNALIEDKIIPEYATIDMDKRDLKLLFYTWLEKHGATIDKHMDMDIKNINTSEVIIIESEEDLSNYNLDENSQVTIIIDDI